MTWSPAEIRVWRCRGNDGVDGLKVFQQPEVGLYQRLVESARARLAELELEYGIEKSKVDSIRSRLFGLLRASYQERDRLRLLVQYRRAFIERLLAEGEEAAGQTAGDYQRASARKDQEYDSTAAALEGKRELNEEETTRLKQLWKKLVRSGRGARRSADGLAQDAPATPATGISSGGRSRPGSNWNRKAGNPARPILQESGAGGEVWDTDALGVEPGGETPPERTGARRASHLDTVPTSRGDGIFQAAEQDAAVIERIAAAQEAELAEEIAGLKAEARAREREIEEMAGAVLF